MVDLAMATERVSVVSDESDLYSATPNTPHLHLVPEVDESAIIKKGDARELLEYFGMGGVSGAFEQSPLAGMLSHAETYAFHAHPCERCGGDRKSDTAGSGFVNGSKRGKKHSDEQRMMLEALGIVIPPGYADRICGDCGGRGWVCPKNPSRSQAKTSLTARPTGSSKHGLAPSITVDASDMATLGTVGKRLGDVRKVHQPAAEALQSWFGTPKGDGGQSTRALWHLTDAGQSMLKENTLGIPAADFFENERKDQLDHPNVHRQIGFKAADKQAEKLWKGTCQLWNSTAPVKRSVIRAEPETEPVAAE